jgi:hypothetical protein
MDGISPDDEPPTSGWSPLSVKLAAYGEAFALEWRLKLVERGEGKVGDKDPEDKVAPVSPTFVREEREPSCTGYAFLGVTAT